MKVRSSLLAGATVLVTLGLVVATSSLADAGSRWRWWSWHRPVPTATPTPSSTPSATAVPTPSVEHSTHQPPATTPGAPPAMNGGLPFDAARIPAGNPGVGFDNVRDTGEKPGVDPDGIGAFRTVCQYSHMRADDPIVKPNAPGASHLHTFWGNTGTSASSTVDSIAGSGNSTCRGGTINRTAYWAPSVIDTSTGTPLAPELIHVYYKSGYAGIRPEQIEVMPPGLRMVAGNATASGPQEHMNWSCFNSGRQSSTIPTCPAGDNVSMNIDFPQCWNGALDSADHKSHLAYPSGGRCPASHPHAIPAISYHVLYPGGTNTATWRLASDMYDRALPGGYSVHGDWFNGWKPDIMQTWTRLCVQRPATTCGSHMLGDGRVMA